MRNINCLCGSRTLIVCFFVGVQEGDRRPDHVALGGGTAHHVDDRDHMTGGGRGLHHVIAVETGPDHVIGGGSGLDLVIVVGIDRGRGGEGIATPTIGRRNRLNLRRSKSSSNLKLRVDIGSYAVSVLEFCSGGGNAVSVLY